MGTPSYLQNAKFWEGPSSRGFCLFSVPPHPPCPPPVPPPIACEIFETRHTWNQVKGIIGCETPTRHLKYSERALQGIRESCVWMWRGQGKESAFFWAARRCLVASWPLGGAVVLGFEDIVGVAWHSLLFQRRCPQPGEGHPSRMGRESFLDLLGFKRPMKYGSHCC